MEQDSSETFCNEIQDALLEVGKELLKTESFTIQSEPLFKEGENLILCSTVYRVRFETNDEATTFSLFLKVAPDNELQRSVLQIHDTFIRETYTYDVVLSSFREFQQQKGIRENGFHAYPMCFKSIITEPFESLFIEDMTLKDFVVIDKDEITVEHVLLVMKTLGRFHAISLAMKDQEPEKFSEIVTGLSEIFFVRGIDSVFANQINYAQTIAFNCITDDSDTHLMKALMRLYETNQYDLLADLVDGNEAEPHSVVLHGDMWNNNIMFDKKASEVCFVDWQVTRYGSPVLDLMYYIFSGTTRELRGRNYNVYLKTYHDSLSEFLIRLGSDPEKLFPFNAFQRQLQKFGKFGLLNATFLLPAHMNGINVDDPTGGMELSMTLKKRFRDIAADSYRLGYI